MAGTVEEREVIGLHCGASELERVIGGLERHGTSTLFDSEGR